ncbi:MAG: hypothetical protein WCQ16_02510 [Verrucomicrobiae bacterium]
MTVQIQWKIFFCDFRHPFHALHFGELVTVPDEGRFVLLVTVTENKMGMGMKSIGKMPMPRELVEKTLLGDKGAPA